MEVTLGTILTGVLDLLSQAITVAQTLGLQDQQADRQQHVHLAEGLLRVDLQEDVGKHVEFT